MPTSPKMAPTDDKLIGFGKCLYVKLIILLLENRYLITLWILNIYMAWHKQNIEGGHILFS